MLTAKRPLSELSLPPKRARGISEGRLCDLRNSLSLFTNANNATRARERGILRSRDASSKYEEYEKKVFALIKDSGGIELPDEDWVLEILPELKLLEPDTLEMLFAQAEQHAKYEAAARDLVNAEVAKYEDAHERELRALRLESESQHTRSSVSAEMRMQAQEEAAREETDRLREEAMEKISELEEEVAKLEEKQQHEEEINEMNEEREKLVEIVDEAQKETELKRETSRKLKEEIIDNDRLTVANLNRIKNLEIEIEETRKLCEKLDDENEELREELGKSLKDEGASAALEREVEMLRELLSEREQQVRSLSLRLADASSGSGAGSGGFGSSSGFNSSSSGRRESILDRLGLNKGPTAI
ncbi:hypothetical protein Ctob_007736 [Chrysochromulina tobinii]|uniref:Uncharacterized protein n=1 Tax=Chrysochromulina tobinii TaxID=1460289 RepID=A0A0M0JB88_9EUKA|nr:hypothetical protein Ctob_007736 [Chrysochromulina tobinii]|eukprot:KOO23622.1 hypothetical protein Ctob_007736 [Chrysochromulina sp. CCMP291]